VTATTRLVQPVDLCLPSLPVELEGLRIAHLSDLHIRGPRRRFTHLRALMGNLRVDLVVLTGDYMTKNGDEQVATAMMHQLCLAMKPQLGVYGVFGNHDTPQLRHQCSDLPIHWLNNQSHLFDGLPLCIMGFEADSTAKPDSVATIINLDNNGPDPVDDKGPKPFSLLLCHYPNYLPIVADMGVNVMIAGHTHGGQWRFPGRRPFTNSCDLPLRLTAGIMRHRNTLAVVTRGLGESRLPLRLFCPPQLPIYTLREGPMRGQETDHIDCIERW